MHHSSYMVSNGLVQIDNVTIPNPEKYRVLSPDYVVTYPENGILPYVGTSPAISDGYWVFVKALEKGVHEIYFHGESSTGSPFVVTVDYETTIR